MEVGGEYGQQQRLALPEANLKSAARESRREEARIRRESMLREQQLALARGGPDSGSALGHGSSWTPQGSRALPSPTDDDSSPRAPSVLILIEYLCKESSGTAHSRCGELNGTKPLKLKCALADARFDPIAAGPGFSLSHDPVMYAQYFSR